MDKIKVLVAEDDYKISRLIQLELEHSGYSVEIAADGSEALGKYEDFRPDVILLDVMMPEIDGVEVAKSIREFDTDVGIIMITAMDRTIDKVQGLNSGADDYITKPFELEEVHARINAVLRRRGNDMDRDYSLGFLRINEESRRVFEKEEEIFLSRTEFDLLLYLMKEKGKAVSKEKLLEEVWGIDFDANPNMVEVYVNYLRKKLSLSGKYITTVRGIGYSLRENQ